MKHLKQQQEVSKQKIVPFTELFRFANIQVKCYMIFGTLIAIINGTVHPFFYFLQGRMYGTFINQNKSIIVQQVLAYLINIVQVGIIGLFTSWFMYVFWIISAEKQTIICKKKYLASLLSQQLGWFDQTNQSELASMFQKSTAAFNQAIGQRIPPLISIISLLISQIIMGIIQGWQLGLVILSSVPLLYGSAIVYGIFTKAKNEKVFSSYQQVDGKAQQALSLIKTIKSMNGQQYQLHNFQSILKKVHPKCIKYSVYAAIANSIFFFTFYICNALAFWYGSQLILSKTIILEGSHYNTSIVVTIILVILYGNQNMNQIEPSLKKIFQARTLAKRMFQIIDRVPLIEKNIEGIRLSNSQFKGIVKFQNVKFAFPKEPERVVLRNISFEIPYNKHVAFTGQSGCGKSTITQLIMRFYDPLQGRITIDGIDIKQFDLQWLRSKIGYVGQQPMLFATSIKQNLLLAKPQATEEQLLEALKKAQAYQFVMSLQNKLETFVGDSGAQLSGGQKQRIAIARALLKKDYKILIFDQATSALDMHNQALIQKTIENISDITTINIAHRINTIKNSDVIFIIQKGMVTEFGKFDQLQKFKNMNFINMINQTEIQNNEIENGNHQNIASNQIEVSQQMKDKKYQESFYMRLFTFNKSDSTMFIVGCFLAAIYGLIHLTFNILAAYMLDALIKQQKFQRQQPIVKSLCIVYLLMSITTLIINSSKFAIFWVIAQNLTLVFRIHTFQKMLKMPVSWLDHPKNRSIVQQIALNCRQLNGITSSYVCLMIQSAVTLLTGLIISLYYDWRIFLISTALLPFILFSNIFQHRLLHAVSNQGMKVYKDSIINQSLINIRTVFSINCESQIQKKYVAGLQQPYKASIKRAHIIGVFHGASILILYIATGLLFYISTIFVKNYNIQLLDSIVSRNSIIFAGFIIGVNMRLLPDFVGGKNAAINMFKLLDSEDQQDMQKRQNSKKLYQGYVRGNIEIKNLSFKYPSRQKYTFQNLNMKIQGGKKVALVGESGVGKSSLLQIFLRFYEPISGQIYIDGINIKDFDIKYLRSLFGVVIQQPALFNMSFRQNIQYNTFDVDEQDILLAAKSAYAYDFIQGNQKQIQIKNLENTRVTQMILSEKFDRNVGIKGSHLSGGQKQRIAIARIMLKKPKILLLDEATSALDKTNEQLVQNALDRLSYGKTCITVAHRIDTIKNSDKIYALKQGKIAEQGSFKQLVRKNGQFSRLEKGIILQYK